MQVESLFVGVLAGLVIAWALVMTGVFFSFSCGRAPSSLNQPFLSELPAPSRQGSFRSVQRQKSWTASKDASPWDMMFGAGRASTNSQIRFAFVRKVYALLATQLLATVLIVAGTIYLSFDGFDARAPTTFGINLIHSIGWLQWVLFIPALLICCILQSVKNMYPINYLTLAAFTVLMGSIVAMECLVYFAYGFGVQILLAAGITTCIFLLLTLYTMCSKRDFEFMGMFLFAGLNLLIIWGFVLFVGRLMFGYSAGWDIGYCVVGSLLFCGFIIFDTHMIIAKLGVDDYIIATIELYLDIINLFLYILRILAASRD